MDISGLLHTQEVTGSSPVSLTIKVIILPQMASQPISFLPRPQFNNSHLLFTNW